MRSLAALHDAAQTLWRELRRDRVRALFSLLGVAWGTLAMLVLLAFSVGMEELFAARMAGLGKGVAIAWPSRTSLSWNGLPAGRAIAITREDALAVAGAVPQLEAMSAEFRVGERVQTARAALRTTLAGVDACYATLRALVPQAGGRFLDARDVAERRRVVFLGDRLAARLFGSRPAVGESVQIGRVPYLVVGVLAHKEQDSDYGGRDENLAFLPATTLAQSFGRRVVNNLVFRAREPQRQAECTAAVVAALAARLRFHPHDLQALSVWDTTEQQRMMDYIFLAFHVVLGIAGLVTLLAGAVGIAHLMHLMVRKRSAELGLALAVGALPGQLRREILGQTVLLVACGGLLGALAAMGIVWIGAAGPWTAETGVPRIPLALGLAATALLLGCGILAGTQPARVASRLDPVAALRS
jgi:putative ABC transport system permease protein